MFGEYFYILGVKFYVYWVYVNAAFVMAGLYLAYAFRKSRIRVTHALIIALMSFIIGFVGSRILSIIESGDLSFETALNPGAGYSYLGGQLLVLPFIFIYLKYYKIDIAYGLMHILIAVFIGYAIGRLGCFFSVDGCYGKPCSLPWCIAFSSGNRATSVPVHPTPLYESLYSIILVFWYKKNLIGKTRQQLFVLFGWALLSFSVCRFAVEFLRRNDIFWMFTASQWLCIGFILLSVVIIVFQKNALRYEV